MNISIFIRELFFGYGSFCFSRKCAFLQSAERRKEPHRACEAGREQVGWVFYRRMERKCVGSTRGLTAYGNDYGVPEERTWHPRARVDIRKVGGVS